MADVDIKRGYEVLSDNNVRFGIRVINNSSFAISDVEVILDYSDDSFKLQGDRIETLGTIPPSVPRTAKFVLQPKGCIHKEELGATVLYKDHEWNKHVEQMRPKEVHCVCPFLKEKSISRAEFLALSKSGYSAESGVNFENIDSAKVVDFLSHTCKNRLYKVDEFPVDGGSIIYMAGDAVGEKAYYLLTAVVKEHEGLTQVFLRANSDKDHGLTGFLNETLDNLRHLVVAGRVREIGFIKKEQVINIIDSVVQRTTFGGGEGGASVNIQDSVVQRTEFYVGEENSVKEGGRRKEEDGQKILRQQRGEKERNTRKKQNRNTLKNVFMLAIVLGALLVGFVMFVPGSDYFRDVAQSSTQLDEEAPAISSGKNGDASTSVKFVGTKIQDILDNPTAYAGAVTISGKISNIDTQGGFMYMQLTDDTATMWVASNILDINEGELITTAGTLMFDFSSPGTGMKYSVILFAGEVAPLEASRSRSI